VGIGGRMGGIRGPQSASHKVIRKSSREEVYVRYKESVTVVEKTNPKSKVDKI
jgi:hypothetical protein